MDTEAVDATERAVGCGATRPSEAASIDRALCAMVAGLLRTFPRFPLPVGSGPLLPAPSDHDRSTGLMRSFRPDDEGGRGSGRAEHVEDVEDDIVRLCKGGATVRAAAECDALDAREECCIGPSDARESRSENEKIGPETDCGVRITCDE